MLCGGDVLESFNATTENGTRVWQDEELEASGLLVLQKRCNSSIHCVHGKVILGQHGVVVVGRDDQDLEAFAAASVCRYFWSSRPQQCVSRMQGAAVSTSGSTQRQHHYSTTSHSHRHFRFIEHTGVNSVSTESLDSWPCLPCCPPLSPPPSSVLVTTSTLYHVCPSKTKNTECALHCRSPGQIFLLPDLCHVDALCGFSPHSRLKSGLARLEALKIHEALLRIRALLLCCGGTAGISSSAVRKHLAHGESIRYLVHDKAGNIMCAIVNLATKVGVVGVVGVVGCRSCWSLL